MDSILAKLPTLDVLNAIDDDELSGRRPLPVTLSLGQWRKLRRHLERVQQHLQDGNELCFPLSSEEQKLLVDHIEACGKTQEFKDTFDRTPAEYLDEYSYRGDIGITVCQDLGIELPEALKD